MATFACPVVEIERLEDHSNADRLSVMYIKGMNFPIVVGKDHYVPNQRGIYFPEGSVLTPSLIAEMELEKSLAGKDKNRVKAVRLRGIVSQGVFYGSPREDLPEDERYPAPSWNPAWKVGDDVAEELGIEKYTPSVPLWMSGKMEPAPHGIWTKYDIENIKRYPDVLQPEELIVLTEKIHGSLLLCGIIDGQRFVSSKGVAARNLVLKEDEHNVYWRAAHESALHDKLQALMDAKGLTEALLFGEVLGVQDLKYGYTGGQVGYRAFDLYTRDGFVPQHQFAFDCFQQGIPTVPVLYQGPYRADIVQEHTTGKSTLADHVREGVVVKTEIERRDDRIGRVILKSVSEAYLLRKGETTEFE